MARGKRTSPEKIEEIKALSIAFEPQTIAKKTGVSLRTVYAILAKKDDPVIEIKREEKRLEIVDKVFNESEEEIQAEVTNLKSKCNMLLDHLTPEKAEKARTTEITTAYGTLFDKRRLLQEKSTANVSFSAIIQQVTEDNKNTITGNKQEAEIIPEVIKEDE